MPREFYSFDRLLKNQAPFNLIRFLDPVFEVYQYLWDPCGEVLRPCARQFKSLEGTRFIGDFEGKIINILFIPDFALDFKFPDRYSMKNPRF